MNQAETWIRQHLTVLGTSNGNLVCTCPFCGSDRLYAHPDHQNYICFKCEQRGRLWWLVKTTKGLTTESAKRALEEPLTMESVFDAIDMLDRIIDAPEVVYVNQPLPDDFISCWTPEKMHRPRYIRQRQISDEALISYGIGYATRGPYRDRMIVPVHCDGHRTFLGRLMGKPSKFTWRSRSGDLITPPKYKTEPGSKLAHLIYQYDNLQSGDHVVLVEGVTDAWRVIELGLKCVAIFGKQISKAQVRLLKNKALGSITILLDAEALAYAVDVATKLMWHTDAKIAILPDDTDPDELGIRRPRKLRAIIRRAQLVSNEAQALSLLCKASQSFS